MAEIVEHNFGKSHRDAARAYGRLVGLLEDRAEAFLNNPDEFFQDAGERIVKYQKLLEEARAALRPHVSVETSEDPIANRFATIVVPRDEWNRLKKCALIVSQIGAE